MFNLSLYQYEIELIHSCISCIYSNIQKKVATMTVAAFMFYNPVYPIKSKSTCLATSRPSLIAHTTKD